VGRGRRASHGPFLTHDVKEGRAPDDFLEYFRIASDGFHQIDCSRGVTLKHRDRYRRLDALLGPYVTGSGVTTVRKFLDHLTAERS
jgi:hypothetical protein